MVPVGASEMLPNVTVDQNSVWVNQTTANGVKLYLYSAYFVSVKSWFTGQVARPVIKSESVIKLCLNTNNFRSNFLKLVNCRGFEDKFLLSFINPRR